jgi:hypothetical protein
VLVKKPPKMSPNYFLPKLLHFVYLLKTVKNTGYFCTFQKLPKVPKQLPIGRKFAASGHPGLAPAFLSHQSFEATAAD